MTSPPSGSTGFGAPQKESPTRRVDNMTRVLIVLVCLEVGLSLLVLPWTPLWLNNFFAAIPRIQFFWPNPYFRGAVSGLGLINLLVAWDESRRLWKR